MRRLIVGVPVILAMAGTPIRAADDKADTPSAPASPEVQREMARWLKDDCRSGGDILASPLVQDWLTVRRLESGLWVLTMAVLSVIGCLLLRDVLGMDIDLDKYPANERSDHASGIMLGLLVSLAMVVVPAIVIANHAHEFFSAWFAPRILVLEYLSDVMKTVPGK